MSSSTRVAVSAFTATQSYSYDDLNRLVAASEENSFSSSSLKRAGTIRPFAASFGSFGLPRRNLAFRALPGFSISLPADGPLPF